MQNLIKFVILIMLSISMLISCYSSNTSNSSSTEVSSLAQYKAQLVYNKTSLISETQNLQQTLVINHTLVLTNMRVNFYSDNSCQSLITHIDSSGESGVTFPAGTYTSSGASNFALCNLYPEGGCSGLYNNVNSLNYEYTYASGSIYSAPCMSGDNLDAKEAIINWSANGGLSPWDACTNSNCGFSKSYTVTLPDSTGLTTSFMLVGDGGSITNLNPYRGGLNNILYPANVGIYGVTSSNDGRVILVGYGGVILTGLPGNMTAAVSGTINQLNAIVKSADNVYVAVGDSGTILRSTDGINWQSVTSGTSEVLYGVAVNSSDRFVAVGANGTILNSTDGINWQSVTSGTSEVLYGVAVNSSDRFVAVGANGTIIYSDNVASWSAATGATSTIYAVTADAAGGFVAVGEEGKIYTSTDGSGNWSSATLATNPYLTLSGITINTTGLAVVVGINTDSGNGIIYYSTTPTLISSWQQSTTGDTAALNGVTVNESGTFIAAGGYAGETQVILLSSAPADGWNTVLPITSDQLLGVAHNSAGNFSAVGFDNTILTSSNGINWNVNALSGNPILFSIMAANNGNFFLTGGSGLIESSTNGTTWVTSNSGTSVILFSIAQSENGLMTAVGDSKTILTSSNDGISWSNLGATRTSYNLHSVAVNESGIFVTVGGFDDGVNKYGIIYSSQDNYTTNHLESGTLNTTDLNGVTVNASGRFVAVGRTAFGAAVIFYSDDGTTWTPATIHSGLLAPLGAVAVNSSGLFVAIGSNGLILTSTDGATWSQFSSIINGVNINGIVAY